MVESGGILLWRSHRGSHGVCVYCPNDPAKGFRAEMIEEGECVGGGGLYQEG